MFQIKKQIRSLYLSSMLGNLSLTGAWVAILSARGFSLVEIGFAETVFHITSILFEIPSGVFADLFGRKKMLIISTIMRMVAAVIMIFSGSFFMVCLSMPFHALSYNFASGSGDALAYDSLKLAGSEDRFERYGSNQLIIYRLFGGLSTLCAGLALFLGYKLAYTTDLFVCAAQLVILAMLWEISVKDGEMVVGAKPNRELRSRLAACFRESFCFLRYEKRAVKLMFCNSFVGAIDILLLFFLQAKLPEKGIPGWALGIALLFMELGGIVGARLILKLPKLKYRFVYFIAAFLVMVGFFAEHSPLYGIAALGGFLSAAADDALQVRTNAILQDMFPSEQRATLTSIESFTFSVLMIVLSPLAGVVFSRW